MSYSIAAILSGLESNVVSSPHPTSAQTVAQGATGTNNGNTPTQSNMTVIYVGAAYVIVSLLALWVGGGVILKGI